MNLPPRERLFLKRIEKLLIKAEISAVAWIIFGSHAKNTATPTSDLDLLVIVADSSPIRKINKVRSQVETLEHLMGFSEPPRNILDTLIRLLERKTGIFVNFFICRESAFKKRHFSEIFGLSWWSILLAPSNFVMTNVLINAKAIYGTIPQGEPIPIRRTDMVKSLFMNLIQVIGLSVIYPFIGLKAFKLSMEAIKWSLFASFTYSLGFFPVTNKQAVEIYAKTFPNLKISKFLQRYLQQRENLQSDPIFLLETPFRILEIHLQTITAPRKLREQYKRWNDSY